jgi:DNA-binding NarL/FixJ family response regulator
MGKINVLLADDHEDVLDTVAQLLAPEFNVVGTVMDGMALLSDAERLMPDVVVVDISMPILNGIDAVRRLRDSGSPAQVVFLTIHESSEYVGAALATGALGYVVKPRLATDLKVAIKEAHAGRSYLSPSIAPID